MADQIIGTNNELAGTTERQTGYERYQPNFFERFSGVGINIPQEGFRGAFYMAQPTSLMVGVLVVMVFSFICMFIAVFVDMSGNKTFIGIALGLPFAIMLVAWISQWIENKSDDNRYLALVNNNNESYSTKSVNFA